MQNLYIYILDKEQQLLDIISAYWLYRKQLEESKQTNSNTNRIDSSLAKGSVIGEL